MGLRKTQGELYEKNSDAFLKNRQNIDRAYDAEEVNPDNSEQESVKQEVKNREISDSKDRLIKNDKELLKKKRKATVIGIIILSIIGAFAVVAVGIAIVRDISFREDRIKVKLEGPSEVSLGELVSYTITIANDNFVSLDDASLIVRFPSGFSPSKTEKFVQEGSQQGVFSLDDISSRDSVQVEFSGIFLNGSDELVYIDTTLRYKVSLKNTLFELSSRIPVALRGVQMAIDIDGTTQVVSGESSEYRIQYRNDSGKVLSDVRLIAEVSNRFIVGETQPTAKKDGVSRWVWELGSLEVGASGSVLFRGSYDQESDSRGDVIIRASSGLGEEAFLLGIAETTTSIIHSLLSIDMHLTGVMDGIVESGDIIPVKLSYTNNSNIGLPSGIVNFTLSGKIWDTANIQLSRGSFNSNTGVISWRASDIPELADLSPGERGEITFSLPVKKSIDIFGPNERYFDSKLSVTIDSPDALSRLGLENVAGYNSEQVKLLSYIDVRREAIESASGRSIEEMEFRVGNEYELSFRLFVGSRYNDIAHTEFSFDIPSEMEWGGFFSETIGETVSYDERRRKVIWNIGSLNAGTGIYEPWRTIGISLRFTPQEYQSMRTSPMISNIRFSGKDTFTGSDISFSLKDSIIRRIVK